VILGLLGLLDGELSRRVRLQTLVWDGLTTPDRSAERPCVESGFSPVEGGESVPKTGRERVVSILIGEQFGRVARPIVGGAGFAVRASRRLCIAKKLLHSHSLGLDQASSPLLVHIASCWS
jgi:hypothetical protein